MHNPKLLLFGGVYSNLEALQALKDYADKHQFARENIICTGDVVGYCANPTECVDLIMSWGIKCIAGNVEEQLASGSDDCGCDFSENSRCDIFSKQWYPYAQKQVRPEQLKWMKSLKNTLQFSFGNKRVGVVHGSAENISEFVFKSSPWAIKEKNFKALNAEIIIAGHCGLPFMDEKDNKLWVNPGVIGMPANDGSNSVWFAEWHPDEAYPKFKRLSYDYALAQEKMRTVKLPEAYAKTLSSGIWDNCDILPAVETAAQGKALTF